MAGAGVGSGTSDFRSCSKKWPLRNTAGKSMAHSNILASSSGNQALREVMGRV